MKRSSLRVLMVQNEGASPPGAISQWLDDQGAEVSVLRVDIEEREADPRDYGLIVPLGSEFPAYDESRPFVVRAKRLLERAVDADVPVLGVCFGGQLLARVLGGDDEHRTRLVHLESVERHPEHDVDRLPQQQSRLAGVAGGHDHRGVGE